MLNISASPFWIGKRELRRDMLASIARQHKVPVVLVNQVGGNDSLVFDGSSLVLNREGQVVAQGRSFEEDLIYFDSSDLTGEMHEQIAGEEASVYSALVLGTRDYMHKCGFQKAIIGLSGGIDSALTAVIAADAVGAGKCNWRGDAGALFVARVRSTMLVRWRRISGFVSNCFPSIPPTKPIARRCRMFSRAQKKTSPKRTFNRAPGARC